MARTRKLSDRAKTFVVQGLACFEKPQAIARAVRVEFGVDITAQSVEAYDPTKRAGANLAPRWKALFDLTRKRYVEELSKIPIAHRSVRLRALSRLATRAEDEENHPVLLRILEQAAKEMGGAYE